MSVDVLQITGDLDKHEKFALIHLFTLTITLEEFHPRALFGTGATNTGINQQFLEWVSRSGFPRCILTAIQEMGRNARGPGMTGVYAVFTDWKLFVKLLLAILLPRDTNTADTAEYDGLNSVISSKSPDT